MRTTLKPACACIRDTGMGRGRGAGRCSLRGLVVLLVSASCAGEEIQRPLNAAVERRIGSASADNRVAVAWNELAYEIAFAEDQFLTFKGSRTLSMMHLAIHDALNSIVPAYERYIYSGERVAAHPIAAAAQAAYEVLLSQYPGEKVKLDAELALWLRRVPDGTPKARGIHLGRATAAAILALREGDGWDSRGSYEFLRGPGQYQTTPPWDGFVLQPGFRFAKPFALASQHQFRPPPPPALGSRAYAAAFNEVKKYGAVDSEARTEDQTASAIWWTEFTEGSMNRLARQLVTRMGTNLWTASRMFAHLNMAMFDGYVVNWDSKYEYNHWRPYTAIRAAGEDGNPDTAPDAHWEPLRQTPPFPEYASAHATVCATSMAVFKRAFGDHVSFTMSTTTAPPHMPTRSFVSFTSAAAECADSRVRLGWHFRYATDAGLMLGRRVARYVVANHLRRR